MVQALTSTLTDKPAWKSHVEPAPNWIISEISGETGIVILDVLANMGRSAKGFAIYFKNATAVIDIAPNTSSPMTDIADATYSNVTWAEKFSIEAADFITAPVVSGDDFLPIDSLWISVTSGTLEADVWFW